MSGEKIILAFNAVGFSQLLETTYAGAVCRSEPHNIYIQGSRVWLGKADRVPDITTMAANPSTMHIPSMGEETVNISVQYSVKFSKMSSGGKVELNKKNGIEGNVINSEQEICHTKENNFKYGF